jgi:hypothetical protein
MNRHRNRKILLSIRERPLPVLWLLVFLAPYLLFSLAAVPHLHAGELPAGVASSHHAKALHTVATADNTSSAEHSSCLLCDWSSGAQSQSIAALHNVASLVSDQKYFFHSACAPTVTVLICSGRGPPLS